MLVQVNDEGTATIAGALYSCQVVLDHDSRSQIHPRMKGEDDDYTNLVGWSGELLSAGILEGTGRCLVEKSPLCGPEKTVHSSNLAL